MTTLIYLNGGGEISFKCHLNDMYHNGSVLTLCPQKDQNSRNFGLYESRRVTLVMNSFFHARRPKLERWGWNEKETRHKTWWKMSLYFYPFDTLCTLMYMYILLGMKSK